MKRPRLEKDLQACQQINYQWQPAFSSFGDRSGIPLALGQKLRPISHEGNIFYEGLPTFDYTTALIRTPELGVEVAKSLGKCRGLLMKNHGSTVVGESIEVATLYAVFLEKAARIQLMATASGDPSWTNDEEAAVKYEQIYTPHRLESMWEYFVRRAKKFRKSS